MARVIAVAALVLCVTFEAPATIAREGPAQASPSEFLGFRVGEERCYRLGPPESLNLGESASWTIRLDRVARGATVAVFEFTHVRNDPPPSDVFSNPPAREYDDPVYARLAGVARLDRSGFPELVELRGERRFRRRTERGDVRYEFRDGTFHIDAGERGEESSIELPDDPALSPSPRGHLFLFVESGLACQGRGNLAQEILDCYGLTVPCETAEPAFTNPGLLELALRSLDRQIDGDLCFLTPNGPPEWRRSPPARAPRGGGMPNPSRRIWSEDPRRDESRYYARVGFRLQGERQVELDGSTVLGRVIEVADADGLESVHVDDRGRVVQLELTDYPVTDRPRWIRLLSAAQY